MWLWLWLWLLLLPLLLPYCAWESSASARRYAARAMRRFCIHSDSCTCFTTSPSSVALYRFCPWLLLLLLLLLEVELDAGPECAL